MQYAPSILTARRNDPRNGQKVKKNARCSYCHGFSRRPPFLDVRKAPAQSFSDHFQTPPKQSGVSLKVDTRTTHGHTHTQSEHAKLSTKKWEIANLSSSENVPRTTKQKKTDSSNWSGSIMERHSGRPLSRLRREFTKTVNIWANGPAFFVPR